jgi:2-iminobutanoate/2-iminopropanoate deaminase
MMIERTNSGLGLPAGLASRFASEANGICVISGMPALDPDGKFVPGTFEEETELTWWRRQFPDVSTAPARFTFQAGALPFGAKIEIQAVAARGT